MKELVVISGKGGAGKTSLLGAFAMLAEDAVLADCDVDAADLHLLLKPETTESERFRAGVQARIDPERCRHCGACMSYCRFGAIREVDGTYQVDHLACEGCGVCDIVCPADAVELPENDCGAWYISTTRAGRMVHARLDPGAENSGRLVTLVRKEAKRIAEEDGRDLILVDGPPGVGCPVIASLGGATAAVIITEPTVSGLHDLKRVLDLTKHFKLPAGVCVNKWDLNLEQSEAVEQAARDAGAVCLGRIGYSTAMTAAQREAKTVIEAGGRLAGEVKTIWNRVGETLLADD